MYLKIKIPDRLEIVKDRICILLVCSLQTIFLRLTDLSICNLTITYANIDLTRRSCFFLITDNTKHTHTYICAVEYSSSILGQKKRVLKTLYIELKNKRVTLITKTF